MTAIETLDRAELVRLYDEQSPGLYRYAYRLLGAQELAEECVADTFTRFLRISRRRPPQGNVRAYLYRAAHNWVVDYYRTHRQTEVLEDDFPSGGEADPESTVLERQRQEHLRQALVALPEEQRTVVELRFLEDWSHEQVAEYLGRSAQATRALQTRAFRNLRKALRGPWMEGK